MSLARWSIYNVTGANISTSIAFKVPDAVIKELIEAVKIACRLNMSATNLNCSISDTEQGQAQYLDCRPGTNQKDYFDVTLADSYCPGIPPTSIHEYNCMSDVMGKLAQPDETRCGGMSPKAAWGVFFGFIAFALCAAILASLYFGKRYHSSLEEKKSLQEKRLGI